MYIGTKTHIKKSKECNCQRNRKGLGQGYKIQEIRQWGKREVNQFRYERGNLFCLRVFSAYWSISNPFAWGQHGFKKYVLPKQP